MMSTCRIVPFPAPKQATAEEKILSAVELYNGHTADHVDNILLEIREALGEALFLHIKPVLTEIMWEFAAECKCIGAATALQRAKQKEATLYVKKQLERAGDYGKAQEKACQA